MHLRGCSTKVIEVDVKPIIDLTVYLEVFIAYLLGSASFLYGLHLRGGPILIGTADVQGVIPPETTIPGEYVSTQYATDDVTQVRHIIHVGKCTSDEDVPLSLAGVDLLALVQSMHLLGVHTRLVFL
jgi:hypothetical protein